MNFVPLVRLHALAEGDMRAARAQGREFLVTRQAGRIHIYDAHCPHAGHLLSHGSVSNGIVRCPGHGLEFDLASGACLSRHAACPALKRAVPVYAGTHVGIEL